MSPLFTDRQPKPATFPNSQQMCRTHSRSSHFALHMFTTLFNRRFLAPTCLNCPRFIFIHHKLTQSASTHRESSITVPNSLNLKLMCRTHSSPLICSIYISPLLQASLKRATSLNTSWIQRNSLEVNQNSLKLVTTCLISSQTCLNLFHSTLTRLKRFSNASTCFKWSQSCPHLSPSPHHK